MSIEVTIVQKHEHPSLFIMEVEAKIGETRDKHGTYWACSRGMMARAMRHIVDSMDILRRGDDVVYTLHDLAGNEHVTRLPRLESK